MKDVSCVVVSSPPSSGKSPLPQLLKWHLWALPEGKMPSIVQLKMCEGMALEDHLKQLTRSGMVNNMGELCKMEKIWVLVDDTQNACDPHCVPLWGFLVKTVGDTDEIERRVKVVTATTHDLDTPTSSVLFKGVPHEEPNATQEEIMDLWNLFSEPLDCKEWAKHRDTLVDISQINWPWDFSVVSNWCDDGWDTVGSCPQKETQNQTATGGGGHGGRTAWG